MARGEQKASPIASCTVQEAADLLNVSLVYLEQLMEKGELPVHGAGTDRRIDCSEVVQYRERAMAETRQTASELTALSQELGLGY